MARSWQLVSWALWLRHERKALRIPSTRSIRIATKEVTDADVAVSADGSWLVFTALGHLFQLPAAGGATKQLTSGPFYDAAPAISPDGTKVAFISDRKLSSQGNVFVLDIASGQIRQVTDEFWVDRPVWSPDGKSVAFLSYQRVGPVGNYWFVGPNLLKSRVRQVGLADGKVETLTEPGFVHAVAFLADGRRVWSVVEPETKGKLAMSRLEVLSQKGEVTTALTVEGVVDRIAVDPSDARGLYLRLYKTESVSVIAPQPEHLAYVTLSDGGPRTVTGLLSRPADWTHNVEDRGAGARVFVAQLSNPLPRPAFGAAKGAIYLGEKGKLWRIDAPTGKRDEVTFSADIAFEFYPGSPPPVYLEKRPASPTSILIPRLAPDGASVILTAAGYLWRQPLAGGAARRLLDTSGFEWGPAALSPDGKKLAYQLSEGDAQQLRIVDLATGQSSTLGSQGRTGRYEPAWSPDGTKLVYTHFEAGPPSYAQKVPSVYLADLVSGKQQKLVDGSPRWQPAAQFSGDGKWVYFTANGQIHRHSTETPGAGEPITALTAFAANGQVSPDGKWLAFRATTRSGWRRAAAAGEGRGCVPLLPFGRTTIQLHTRRDLARLLDGGRGVAPSAQGWPTQTSRRPNQIVNRTATAGAAAQRARPRFQGGWFHRGDLALRRGRPDRVDWSRGGSQASARPDRGGRRRAVRHPGSVRHACSHGNPHPPSDGP